MGSKGRDVIVLDQDAIIEMQTMVLPSACSHSIFVQDAKSRGCFTSVDYVGITSLNCCYIT